MVIETAGDEARSAAAAADTHAALATIHRMVAIPADAGTGLFEPPRRVKKYWTPKGCPVFFGAGDEARTRYLDLGKVALYQMSYARGTELIIAYHAAVVNPEFAILR